MTKCNKVTMSVSLCLLVLASVCINKLFSPSYSLIQVFKEQGFHDTFNITQHGATPNVTNILVVTYMRSGSSLTAESLQHGPEVSFYSFEPFWYNHMDLSKTFCKGSNCSVANQTINLSQMAVSIIKKIFECKMSSLPDEVLYAFSFFKHLRDHEQLKDCFPMPKQLEKITNNATLRSMMERKQQCLSFLEARCRNSTVRVIKTIRFPLHLCKELLESTDTMKVLHLVRDPRAVVYSRRSLGLDLQNSAIKELCNKIYHDIEEGQVIAYYFPGRFFHLDMNV